MRAIPRTLVSLDTFLDWVFGMDESLVEDAIRIECRVCGRYSVTYLNRTPIF